MWSEEDEEGRVREKSKVDLVTGVLELVGACARRLLTVAQTILGVYVHSSAAAKP